MDRSGPVHFDLSLNLMLHHINWSNLLAGASAFGILSHAANTIPIPKNQYGRWAVGILQYALANYQKGGAALQPPGGNQ